MPPSGAGGPGWLVLATAVEGPWRLLPDCTVKGLEG
tara:strand:- start:97 stop:204 length:108 start_codon:yes stop_codon:yes gene_type:complete